MPTYPDTPERLAQLDATTWTLVNTDNEVETYKLIGAAQGAFQRKLSFIPAQRVIPAQRDREFR